MAGYTRFVIGGVMTGLFVIMLTIFAVNFAIDNDSDISLAEDSRYGSLNVSIQSDVSTYANESETSQEIFFGTTLESGDEHASTGGQFKIGPLTAVGMALKSFNTAFFSIFGREFAFVAVALVSTMTFILGYFGIKAWLGRSPD